MTGWQEYGYYNLSRTYDSARGWLTGLTAASHLNLSYAYNNGGQATSVTDTINPGQGVTSYTYDNLDRLSTATTPNWGLSWTYDNFGNRRTQTGTGTASSLTQTLGYDGTSNHITSISTYFYGIGYDANGNASQIPGTNGQYSYLSLAYDVFDRVIHESGNYMGAGPSTAYDAFGRRIAKNLTDGTTRIYFYDPAGREIAEYNFNPNATCNYSGTYYTCTALGSPTATYTYFAGQRVGQWTDRVGSRRYTPVGSTASSYYPYGEDVTGNPTNNDTFKFAQTYRDSDSGLDYAMERYLSSGIGRFLTPDRVAAGDPTQPQSLNGYGYANGDPVNGVDPSGRDTCFLNGSSAECGFVWSSVCSGSASFVDTNEPLTEVLCDFQFGVVAGAYNAVNAIANALSQQGPTNSVTLPKNPGVCANPNAMGCQSTCNSQQWDTNPTTIVKVTQRRILSGSPVPITLAFNGSPQAVYLPNSATTSNVTGFVTVQPGVTVSPFSSGVLNMSASITGTGGDSGVGTRHPGFLSGMAPLGSFQETASFMCAGGSSSSAVSITWTVLLWFAGSPMFPH